MELSALASGSSGNCFYVENNGDAVLIDAGISAKQIVERLDKLRKSAENVRGIFITHEHGDHVRGADVFSRQFKVPIFATKKTAKNCFLCSDEKMIHFIKNNETVSLGGMKIEAFSKPHSGEDPVSYNIFNGKKISVITDIGYASQNVIDNVADSDFLCLESNHDEMMLETGPYPYFLKKWIKGNEGHLSNLQAALCVLEHANNKLRHIVLSHLSQTNNKPELALETFNFLLKERKDISSKVSVSERFNATPLFRV
jgi:phosphoribosyl 1,2-cyclic phosphodiesterase